MQTTKVPGIISLLVALGAVVNFILQSCGLPCIAVDEGAITGVVTGLAGFIGILGTVWHNFNMTTASKIGQQITDGIKNGSIDLGDAQRLVIETAKKVNDLKETTETQ